MKELGIDASQLNPPVCPFDGNAFYPEITRYVDDLLAGGTYIATCPSGREIHITIERHEGKPVVIYACQNLSCTVNGPAPGDGYTDGYDIFDALSNASEDEA